MQDGTVPAAVEPAFRPALTQPALTQAVQPAGAPERLVLIHLPGADLWRPFAALQRLGWHPIIPWTIAPAAVAASTDSNLADELIGLRHLVPDGAVIFGRIPHSAGAIAALSGTRKILVVGELRGLVVACLQHQLHDPVSASELPGGMGAAGDPPRPCRREQMCQFLRGRGPALFDSLLSSLTWATDPDVVILRLEDMPVVPVALRDHSDNHVPAALQPFIREAARTVADKIVPDGMADKPVSLADIWSDEAERLFTAFGGCHLNQALGYDQPYMVTGHARPS